MENKVIIITGGSSGMGKYMAKKFVEEGAHVVITGRDEEKLWKAKQEITNNEDNVLTVVMDVRNPEDVTKMKEESLKAFGKIDALVNNAAGNFIVPTENLSVNGWNAVINIVLNGTFYCSREIGEYWIKNNI